MKGILADRSAAPVAIVVSEKTAIIASGFIPDYLWFASNNSTTAR